MNDHEIFIKCGAMPCELTYRVQPQKLAMLPWSDEVYDYRLIMKTAYLGAVVIALAVACTV